MVFLASWSKNSANAPKPAASVPARTARTPALLEARDISFATIIALSSSAAIDAAVTKC